MAVKKSEIYASLWKSCDELRGGMDASQYKDYVLVLLFVKYVSDKYHGKPDALIEVPDGGGFPDMVKLKGDKEIGDKINKIIARLAEANDLKGVIDVADFNDPDKLGSGKEMVDRLSNLVAIFNKPELDFRKNRAEGDDLLGDAYEYLMRHFATESGKSKGQFYTPAEVSRIMAQVIGIGDTVRQGRTLYDPACGSGSLLLKAWDETHGAAKTSLGIFGQEMDNATRALAKMNMILHGYDTADIWRGNTLANPHFKNPNGTLKTFDFAVANPPFSNKAWTSGFDPDNDEFRRFEDGVPPAKNGDYAFLLHVLASLKSSGKGAIILPHGVLFRGNAEAAIRRNIVRRGYIKGIIGLPANLFYGTGIPACIIVLDKEYAAARKGIFMIDASKGFVKDGNKNRLRAQDIHKIVDVFTNQVEVEKYARMVSFQEIEAEDCNLNIPRYIDTSAPEDLHDIAAHLRGGIPRRDVDALDDYWTVMPGPRDVLFGPADRDGYLTARVEARDVKAAIHGHADFQKFAGHATDAFETWQATQMATMRNLGIGSTPKKVIHTLSESLLAAFDPIPLIDAYDVYQHLMVYWAATMQDDVYQIAQDGWLSGRIIRTLEKNNDGKWSEEPDLVIGTGKNAVRLKADLIPPALIVARYFADEQAAVEALERDVEEAARTIEEMDEDHGGEDGLLAEARTDKGKLTAASVKARLKEVKDDDDAADEAEQLKTLLRAIETEARAKKAHKEAKATLDKAVVEQYPVLGEEEIKALVIDDKWLARLSGDVRGELDRVAQGLTGRVKLLAERYATPLPALEDDVAQLSAKVDAHLERMGVRA